MESFKIIKLSCILGLSLTAITMPMKAMACSYQPFIGGMCAFAGNFAIRGWAKAEGQLLAISSNAALFSILGTLATTFTLYFDHFGIMFRSFFGIDFRIDVLSIF